MIKTRLLTYCKERSCLSTKQLRWLIEHNRCLVNGEVERFASRKVECSDQIELDEAPFFPEEELIYEDAWIMAWSKSIHLSSSELAKRENALLVHRLDRDTSGLILLAKNVQAQKRFEDLFRQRKIEKRYLAITVGAIRPFEGSISFPLSPVARREGAVLMGHDPKGKQASTVYTCLRQTDAVSYLELFPKTGRTHQLRVHLKLLGHPILGDYEYGPRSPHPLHYTKRPMLHAASVAFAHPFLKQKCLLEAPLHEDFRSALETFSLL